MTVLSTSKINEKLGIRILPKILVAEPNYVQIALKWFQLYEKTGSNEAYLATRHFLRVAEELDQAEILDDLTVET
jgi:hypothetical protein